MGERRIAGRYELVEQLGTSSWLAVDTDLERQVLVRMPGRDVAAARLTHHGIVPLFDQGEEEGIPYAVYEYLAGGSLERRLATAPLSEVEADRVAAAVTAALAYAHEQGVTHGSIGPASVMLSADGDAKLAGFAGTGTTEEDDRALAVLLATLGATATATAASDADATAILPPAPKPSAGRRPLVLAGLGTLALLAAGVGAALLATSGESTPAGATTGSASVSTSTGSTQEPSVPPASTTAEETMTETTTTAPSPPATAPTTTAPPTAPPATTETATTEPVPTTEPPPPEPTEPPPATEPAPPTEATTQAPTTG